MSNEKKLYQTIMSDPNLLAEVSRAGTTDECVATVKRISESRRLPVSTLAIVDFFRNQDQELSDADLEMVVGGKGNPNQDIMGDDWAWIGLPDDNIDGGDGNDTIRGGEGEDTIYGGTGDDELYGDGISNTGPDGADLMDGGAGNDQMRGGAGNDTMDGGTGNDFMSGGTGNDVMDGGAGNDRVYGGDGSDTIDGGAGNDRIDGGTGDENDVLTGGSGNDVFVFGNNDGTDVITDFNPAEDKLELLGWSSDVMEVSAHGGDTFISYGETTIILEGVEMTTEEVEACRVH